MSSNFTTMVVKQAGIAYASAVVAYVKAKGGSRTDLEEFLAEIAHLEPTTDPLRMFDQFDEAWLLMRRRRR